MKKHIQFLAVILAYSAVNGCGGSKFNVKSDPLDAEVFVLNEKTGVKKPLGKTPLEMTMPTVKETVGEDVMEGDFFAVMIEKKGFLSQTMYIPATRFGTLMTSIEVSLKAGDEHKQVKLASEILDHLYAAQRLAVGKEYERAQMELDKLLAVSPGFARALSMRGSIYFVQRKYAESLKWYEEALKEDPKMEEPTRMMARIKQLQNGTDTRIPASAQAPNSSAAVPAAPVTPASGGIKR